MIHVPDDGDAHGDHRIVLIGEAPGRHEVAQRRPFVGPSGNKLSKHWHEVGLERGDFYITNVLDFQPPGNKFAAVPKETVSKYTERLHKKLAKLNANLIVPCGSWALQALLGKKIMQYRGSILHYTDLKGRDRKVMPVIHPAATFRRPKLTLRCERDWQRIARESRFPDFRSVPTYEHHIGHEALDTEAFLGSIPGATHQQAMSVDVENTPTTISCVGFSHTPFVSWVIPTLRSDYARKSQWIAAWKIIEKLCNHSVPKVLQYGCTDMYKLRLLNGIEVANAEWDLLTMHHCLDPTEDHSLAFMASMYTEQPYWKWMRKMGRSVELEYNGIDNCVQRQIFPYLFDELEDRDLLDFYVRHYRDLARPLLDAMTHGIRVDTRGRKVWHAQLTAKCIEIQDRLAEIAGERVYAQKDFSPVKISRLLYETLGLPRMRNRNEKGELRVTTDQTAIKTLRMKFAGRHPDAPEALDLILKHRRSAKLASFLSDAVEDPDGRVRCTYSMSLEENDKGTGRIKCKKNPLDGGAALHTIDREIRRIYKPDEGCLLLEADLSQVEWRFVGMFSRDPEMIQLARTRPHEYDAHTHAAVDIYDVPFSKVSKQQRYIAKHTVHAADYGVQGKTLSKYFLDDADLHIPADECQAYIDSYVAKHPGVLDYQLLVRRLIMNDGALANTWGRILSFEGERLGDDIYRKGYAFLPQSEDHDLMCQWGFIPTYHYLAKTGYGRFNINLHDGIHMSVEPDHAYDVMKFIRDHIERPRIVFREPIVIPVSFTLSSAWGQDKMPYGIEWKQLPTKKEIRKAVRTLLEEINHADK